MRFKVHFKYRDADSDIIRWDYCAIDRSVDVFYTPGGRQEVAEEVRNILSIWKDVYQWRSVEIFSIVPVSDSALGEIQQEWVNGILGAAGALFE